MISRSILSAALLLVSSSSIARGDGPSREQQSERTLKVQTLSQEVLGANYGPGEGIAVVRVESVEIVDAGTRNEHAAASLQIERVLAGSPPAKAEAWDYTSGGNTFVKAGHRYLIVLVRGMGPAPYGLDVERIELSNEKGAEVVQRHVHLLEALSKDAGPRP